MNVTTTSKEIPRQFHPMVRTSLVMNLLTFQWSSAWNSQLHFQVPYLIDKYVMKLPSSWRSSGISNKLRKLFVKSFVKRTVKTQYWPLCFACICYCFGYHYSEASIVFLGLLLLRQTFKPTMCYIPAVTFYRASGRSREKKSNFAGFSGTNLRKKWAISQEFRGNFWGQFRWQNDR